MASLTDESQFYRPQMLRDHEDVLNSPGPLNLSDLDPQTASPHSRPQKLEPLQHKSVAKTKRKKTRKKKRDREQREQQREEVEGSERDPGEISEFASHSDPLRDSSTLQQMQARLDPLYNAPPPTDHQNGNTPHSCTVTSLYSHLCS